MGRKLHIVNQSQGKYALKQNRKNKAKTPLPEDSYCWLLPAQKKSWTEEARSDSRHSEGTPCGSWLQECVDPDMDWKTMEAGQFTGSALKRKHNSYLLNYCMHCCLSGQRRYKMALPGTPFSSSH